MSDRLTPAQEEAQKRYEEEWFGYATSTEPADWEMAAPAAKNIYRLMEKVTNEKFGPPERYWNCASPLSACILMHFIDGGTKSKLLDVCRPMPEGPLYDVAEQMTKKEAKGWLKGRGLGSIEGRFKALVDYFEGRWPEPQFASWNGQHDAYWTGYYKFRRDECGQEYRAPYSELLDEWDATVRSMYWWYPGEEHCLMVNRPEELHYETLENNQIRFHRTDGPAIKFRDGYGIYMVESFQVNPLWVDLGEGWEGIVRPNGETNIQRIRGEENVELRRVMRQLYGESRYIMETNPTIIDSDYGPKGMSHVPRVLVEDDGDGDPGNRQRWLIVGDGSTDRTYPILAPREATTCRQAHEAISGIDETLICGES